MTTGTRRITQSMAFLPRCKQLLLVAAAALTLIEGGFAQANPGCPVQPATLKAMRNCYRPVLIFALSSRDASFVAQQALLEKYADDMMDRNLLYIPVLAQASKFEAPLDAPYVEVSPAERNAIRARFAIDAGAFVVILIGKDGGEKFRSNKPVSVLKLDALIDAMPMGRQEKNDRSATPR